MTYLGKETTIRWLGHATFLIGTPSGRSVRSRMTSIGLSVRAFVSLKKDSFFMGFYFY